MTTLAEIHAAIEEQHASRVREAIEVLLEETGWPRHHADKLMPKALAVIAPVVDEDFVAFVGREALN